MRIDNDPKLDYSDVLIRPKRSTLSSRKEVSLSREFVFKHSDFHYSGVPIMAANMDTVGTFEMAKALDRHGMFTCIHKHYTLQQWKDATEGLTYDDWLGNVALSTGSSTKDFAQTMTILEAVPDIRYVCLDVANGYTETFVDAVRGARRLIGAGRVLIAGNVVTADMTEALILAGADVVKVGIGPGCFLPGTIVNTTSGPKPIEEVQVGDIVKTHTGAEKPVIDTLVYNNTKPIISINGIKSTDTHEYYVLHKKYKDAVTDDNIHDFAEWVEARNLTKDYMLINVGDK